MSEPIASKAPAKAQKDPESVAAIARRVVTSRKFALRVLVGAVGAVSLGWLGPKAALLGLIASQLLGDFVEEVVTTRKWSLRRIWFVVALFLLIDFARRATTRLRRRPIERHARSPLAAPVVSTLAATAIVVGAFTVIDAARGESPLNDGRTTFFGGHVARLASPALRLPDGRVVVEADANATRLSFGEVRVGTASPPRSLVLSSGSRGLHDLVVAATPAEFRLESACPRTLPPRSSCTMTVVFRPARAGHATGGLTVAFATDPELDLELTGTAVPVTAPTFAPKELRFPGTRLNTTTEGRTLTLRAGSADLPIGGASIDSRDYRIARDDCPHRLAAQASCTIAIVFHPVARGARDAALAVARGDGGAAITARLTGTGIAPTTQPTLTPAGADFGSVQVGSTSAPITFTLVAGSEAFGVADIATGSKDFTLGTVSCPPRLAPKSGCTIEVAFAPTAQGALRATLTATRAGGPRLTAALLGTATPTSVASLSPPRADFGGIERGLRSTEVSFTLAAGTAALEIAGVTTGSRDFRITSDTCPTRLDPSASCTIGVTFAPVATGSLGTTLAVDRGNGAPPLTSVLSGDGLPPPTHPVLQPQQVDFGSIPVRSSSKPIDFTLTAGSQPLQLAGISTASKEFRITSTTCGTRLDASTSCTIAVVFGPLAVGARSATLSVRGTQLSAALTGIGLAVPATLTPTQASFGSVAVGSNSKPIAFTLTAGSDPLAVPGVGAASNDYRVSSRCPSTLGAWSSCTIDVTFAPVGAGSRQATLSVGGTSLKATLTGIGLAAVVVLSPISWDFGNVCTDCGTPGPTKQVVLSNTGTAPLLIKAITSSDKQFAVTKCPSSLPAGQNCVFTITFNPATPGSYSATVTIAANGFGQHRLTVTGSGSIG
jgi:hypothetical protein